MPSSRYPAAWRDGLRYYRTGDLGRVLEGGWIELLGRNDFQIKIRGMRIELADIEYTLRRAPGVKDGALVARPAPSGEKMLVAYVVGETAGLRRYMHARRGSSAGDLRSSSHRHDDAGRSRADEPSLI
jgi:acyl-coenzyme A synthetase/AMP-(fatty) acid ligase